METQTAGRVERRRQRDRINRTHIRAYLDAIRYNGDEIDEPEDWQAMRPHVFGDQEATRWTSN